jgi:hypothetical protein
MAIVQQAGTPVELTSTGTISKVSGVLIGFLVATTTSGTIVLRQGSAGTSNGTAFTGTITPTAGTFTPVMAMCVDGCHATIANTIDVTFIFAAD